MGKYNSSTYRVSPLIEYINGDLNRVNKFLAWFGIKVDNLPTEYAYGDNEKLLKPTKEHLLKMVDYFSKTQGVKVPTMTADRVALLLGNPQDRELKKKEAIQAIENTYDDLQPSSNNWFLFEGFTHPDVFIEGKDYVIIGEGKWTEPHITTNTSNLPVRNQMIRHIQAAQNYTNKKVYAFYLVDKECGYLNDLTIDSFKRQLKEETIHINDNEQERIANSFYGFITWQDISSIFPDIRFLSKEEIDLL